ncbi:unnamed protein product, partial [Trichobilharzia regenti]
ITKAKISANVLKQSASIKVNEEGVEAAAATVISFSLRRITKAKISADVLKQSASIKVNEEGVEAAAATVISFSLTSVRNQRPILFNVNESFVCFIYDKVLNTPLFAGRVITPVALKD